MPVVLSRPALPSWYIGPATSTLMSAFAPRAPFLTLFTVKARAVPSYIQHDESLSL